MKFDRAQLEVIMGCLLTRGIELMEYLKKLDKEINEVSTLHEKEELIKTYKTLKNELNKVLTIINKINL